MVITAIAGLHVISTLFAIPYYYTVHCISAHIARVVNQAIFIKCTFIQILHVQIQDDENYNKKQCKKMNKMTGNRFVLCIQTRNNQLAQLALP